MGQVFPGWQGDVGLAALIEAGRALARVDFGDGGWLLPFLNFFPYYPAC